MANVSPLERSLRVYKAKYDETDDFFLSVLGIGSRTTWKKLRDGDVGFSAKQLKQLSDVLGMGMEDLYCILPPINH